MIVDKIKTFAWQIGAVAAAGALVVASGFLIAAEVENRRVTELNRVLDTRISDPETGYVAKLAQAQTNTETVKMALEGQVKDLQKKAEEDAARLRETTLLLAAAQRDSAMVRKQVDDLLAFRPKDIGEADAKVLEMLK